MLSPDVFLTKVKPACETFIRSPTTDHLDSLNEEMYRLEDNTLDRFQSYILIPLLMKMDNLDGGNGELKVELATTLNRLIKRIKVKDKSAIKTVLIVGLKQIFDFQTSKVDVSVSEELKTAIVQCLSSTFESSTTDTLENFYYKENAGIIGKIALICVELINTEKYKKLRLAAIECLMSAFYVHDSVDFSDIVTRDGVADIVFVFLPKIVHTLVSVANGDEKQGQQLISQSIKCLGRILCLIFEDYHCNQQIDDFQIKDFVALVNKSTTSKKTDDEILGMNINSTPLEERFKTLQNLERTSEWFGASSRKLAPVLKTMIKLRANTSTLVRKEYALMCCTLIEKCHKNLIEILPIFIENIFALSQDEDEIIRTICKNCLNEMKKNQMLSSILAESVTNLFEMHLISLPRIIHRWEHTEQLAEFLFLKGILENSGEECLTTILCIPNNIEKFCNCLIVALELEMSNDLLIEEYAIRDVANTNNQPKPFCWRKFKNISDEAIISLIKSICEILGQSKIFDLVFDHLIGLLGRNVSECNEVLLMLIMMLNGENSRENVLLTLEEILRDQRWNLELQPNSMHRMPIDDRSSWYVDRTPGLYESAIEIRTHNISLDDDDDEPENLNVNISEAQFHVLHTCLLLDAIGNLVQVIGRKFESYLYSALHKVLQKAGSTNYAIHHAGMFALIGIQRGLKLNSIPDLIQEYSNYIAYHVNITLKKAHNDNSAFDILTTVLQYSSFNSLSYLENIIETILEESSKLEQSSNIESFLKVFHMVLQVIEKWSKEFEVVKQNEELPLEHKNFVEPFDQYYKWVEILNKPCDDEELKIKETIVDTETVSPQEMEHNVPEEDESSNAKTVLPRHIEIVIRIMKEALKFISSKNHMHQIISIECIITGLPLLCDYENELLPIVHLIWYPFAQRFKEKNVIVLNRCFTLLEVLAIYAKDFLLQRTLKDIFPYLNNFLRDSSKNSLGKTFLVETQEFKLQSKLLIEYPTLIESMGVDEEELDRICETVLLYLNRKQPKQLQGYAVEYFQKISRYNCPAVHIKIASYESCSDMIKNIAEPNYKNRNTKINKVGNK